MGSCSTIVGLAKFENGCYKTRVNSDKQQDKNLEEGPWLSQNRYSTLQEQKRKPIEDRLLLYSCGDRPAVCKTYCLRGCCKNACKFFNLHVP